MTDVRQVASALRRSDVVALGAFESRVSIAALDPYRILSTIETVLDPGGDRLALCAQGDRLIVVAGAWERHGVCGYDALSGAMLWQRKDLKRVGPLAPAGDGDRVAVALDRRSMEVLDATSGETVVQIRGADRLWQSSFGPIAATGWYQQLSLLDSTAWKRRWRAPVKGFAFLDVAFGTDGLIVSDAEGHVYGFDLEGKREWMHRLPADMSCWTLGWDDAASEWVMLAHNVEQRTPDELLRSARNGEIVARFPIDSVVAADFTPDGRTLVTDQFVVDARTGIATRHTFEES